MEIQFCTILNLRVKRQDNPNVITPPVIPPGTAPYTGDAASDIGAIGWHEMGFYGKHLENSVEKRVKVGIIDRGFRGFTAPAAEWQSAVTVQSRGETSS